MIIIRHEVADYIAWRSVYDAMQPLRDSHNITAERVFTDPVNPNAVTVLHEAPTLPAAQAFLTDPGLGAAMANAGVTGAPRIEVCAEV